MRHFIYPHIHPFTKEKSGAVGMVSIIDESQMDRVPEGAKEVGPHPVKEDKEGAYFDAWEIGDDGEVTVNIEKAKEVRMGWLRKRRDNFLLHLDSVQFRYYCSKDQEQLDSLEEEKQRLRDVPERINWESVRTLHDVKHVFPPELI